MKRLLYLSILLLLFGCGKSDSESSGGIFIDGKKVTELRYATTGGAMPNGRQTTHRLRIYEDRYSTPPRIDTDRGEIHITGLRDNDRTYNSLADCLNYIAVFNLPGMGSLIIPLKDGRFEGSDDPVFSEYTDLVSAVDIRSYRLEEIDEDGNHKKDAQIDIRITLKDSRIIDILYEGKTPWDGLL